MQKFTSIGRPMDMSYATNRLIMLIFAVVFGLITVFGYFFRQMDFVPALGYGFGMAIGVFFAWAIARELDPDHDYSAFIGSGFALIAMFIFYPPDFVGLIWLLLILRIINRSTGLPARITDSLLVSIIATYLICKGGWIYGLFSIIAFLLDSFLDPQFRDQLYFAALNAVITVLIWIFRGIPNYSDALSIPILIIAISISLLAIPLIAASSKTISLSDITHQKLNSTRIQAAQLFALAFALIILFYEGNTGMRKLSVLWAVFPGLSIYCLLNKMKKPVKLNNKNGITS